MIDFDEIKFKASSLNSWLAGLPDGTSIKVIQVDDGTILENRATDTVYILSKDRAAENAEED